MGERKVLNKYFPPDFDPAKIPRRKQPKNQQATVRMMLPMSIHCANCEITFKTDPKNSDYTVESGAIRNFEPWRAEDEEMEKEKQKRAAEEIGDSMKALENRTLDSKRRMDIDVGVDELKSRNARRTSVSVDAILEANMQRRLDDEKAEALEDEAVVRTVVFGRSIDPIIKRIHDEQFAAAAADNLVFANNSPKRRKFCEAKGCSITDWSNNNRDNASSSSSGTFKSSSVKLSVVKKSPSDSNRKKIEEGNKQEAEKQTSNGLLSLCQQYDSSDEDI
ncbi:hypothetical protein HAX54_026622 [Datura stramonium]|uniref:Uncharacterized protein n=1 Tax=Datura stramonium TaxID=4076 RepID=A0ABS8S801_DATST|nr:hypothetical protein [Datura stramonium]